MRPSVLGGLVFVLATVATACSDVVEPPTLVLTKPVARLTDLDPGAAGIFVADVSPDACFMDVAVYVYPDADRDWLDDDCEFALAQAFSPEWRLAWNESCHGGEPAWAAKYFPAPANVVRVSYMPAYYRDCGDSFGFTDHNGDSEMVTVEIAFNSTTNHWEFRKMFHSAHFGTGNDQSSWVASAEFPDRDLGYPRIYVSLNKHANYRTINNCANTWFESPCGGGPGIRFTLAASRNAGSRHNDLLNCVFSTGAFQGSGRCEQFYGGARFRGWFPVEFGGDAGPYRRLLMNHPFEIRDGDWGPGPTWPGQSPNQWTNISGPTYVQPGALCQYFVSSSLSAYSIEWLIDGNTVGSGGSIWLTMPQETFILHAIVSDGTNNEPDSKQIVVSPSAPACSTEF